MASAMFSIVIMIFQLMSATFGAPLVPAYFVIGDSLVDTGNNNFLLTIARSNYFPYGQQFDTHMATGRFTNGRTTTDYIATMLGLPLLPLYLDPETKGRRVLQGVNFASGGAGILKSTGSFFGRILPISDQIELFEDVKNRILKLIGQEPGSDLIANSLVTIVVGGNDYMNNYFLNATSEARTLNPAQFQGLLISTYKSHIEKLYQIGVRKLHLVNIPPLGCIPKALSMFGSDTCVKFVDDIVTTYNAAFESAVLKHQATLPGLKIIISDIYKEFTGVSLNAAENGFSVVDAACCGIGSHGGGFVCIPLTIPCQDVDEHIFFDAFHTTDRFNQIISSRLFYGDGSANSGSPSILDFLKS